MIGKILKDIVSPLTVNLLTALILFTAAVLFKSDILKALGLDTVDNYPIVCAAEMYQSDASDIPVWMDFYLINNSGMSLSKDELNALLANNNKFTDVQYLSGGVQYSSEVFFTLDTNTPTEFEITPEMQSANEAFNKGKGGVTVTRQKKNKTLTLQIDQIEAYSVLKTSVALSGFEKNLRGNRGMVPTSPIANKQDMFETCFTVGP